MTLAILVSLALFAGCDETPTDAPLPSVPGLPEDHLTDAELVTEADPDALPVDTVVAGWVIENNYPIRSLESANTSDLAFLAQFIGDRSIVLLGESGHGVREFSQAKVRVIQYLHEELGFDVVVFESGILECFQANRIADTLSPRQLMGSIHGVWNTAEVLPLFEYIKGTRATARPLEFAGYQGAISSVNTATVRPVFLHDILEPVDSVLARDALNLDGSFLAAYLAGIVEYRNLILTQGDAYRQGYDAIAAFMDNNMEALEAARPGDEDAVLIARRIVASVSQAIRAFTMGAIQSVELSDHVNANNLSALIEGQFTGRKVVVWAHNFHIRHNQQDVSGDTPSARTMGGWLADTYRDEMYTVGLYMYRGSAINFLTGVYAVADPAAGSLESILYRARRKHFLIDLLSQERAAGNDWIFGTTTAKSWGLTDQSMVLRDQYDAILFVDTVHPAQLLPPSE